MMYMCEHVPLLSADVPDLTVFQHKAEFEPPRSWYCVCEMHDVWRQCCGLLPPQLTHFTNECRLTRIQTRKYV